MKKIRFLSVILVITLIVSFIPMTVGVGATSAPIVFDRAYDHASLYDGSDSSDWTDVRKLDEGAYLAITDRQVWNAQIILRTSKTIKKNKNYTVSIDFKTAGDDNEDFSMYFGWKNTSDNITGNVCGNGIKFSSLPDATTAGWKTFTHTFKANSSGKLGFKLIGGATNKNDPNGFAQSNFLSTSDLYIDNVYVYEEGTLIYECTFDSDADMSVWGEKAFKPTLSTDKAWYPTFTRIDTAAAAAAEVNSYIRVSERKSFSAGVSLMFPEVVFEAGHTYKAKFMARSHTTSGGKWEDIRMFMYRPGINGDTSNDHNTEVTGKYTANKTWTQLETANFTPTESGNTFQLDLQGYWNWGSFVSMSDFDIDDFRIYDLTVDPNMETNLITGTEEPYGFDDPSSISHAKPYIADFWATNAFQGSTVTWADDPVATLDANNSVATFAPANGVGVVAGTYVISGTFRIAFDRNRVVLAPDTQKFGYEYHAVLKNFNKLNIKLTLTDEDNNVIEAVPTAAIPVGTGWTDLVFEVYIPTDRLITDISFRGVDGYAPIRSATRSFTDGADTYEISYKNVGNKADDDALSVMSLDVKKNGVMLTRDDLFMGADFYFDGMIAPTTIPFEVKSVAMECIQTVRKDNGAASAGVVMIVLAKMRAVEELGLNVKELETNSYAHVYNRLCIASGLKYDTGVKGEIGKTYTLSFDLRNKYPDEDFRLNIAGSDSSNAYGFELTNGGNPYSDKWETYRFTFNVKDPGNIVALLHGGYNRIGIYATMSDFDFDNVYLVDEDDETKTNLITGTMEPVTFDDNIDGCTPLTITPEVQNSTVIRETEVLDFASSDTVNEDDYTTVAVYKMSKKVKAGEYTISGTFRAQYNRDNILIAPMYTDGNGYHLLLHNYNRVKLKAIVMTDGGVQVATVSSRTAFIATNWVNINFTFELEEDTVIKGIKFIGYGASAPAVDDVTSVGKYEETVNIVSDNHATILQVIKPDGTFAIRSELMSLFEAYAYNHIEETCIPFDYADIKLTFNE